MGTISKGILGGFSGKVGTVVGANWRGKDIIRSLPKKSQRTATEQQMIVRAKFTLVTQFLTPVAAILRSHFGQSAGERSRRNLAVSYHIREAVTGTYPDFTLDYQKVVITKGELPGLQEPGVTPEAGGNLAITWEDNSTQGLAKPEDTLLAVVYNPVKNLFEDRQVALRSALTYDMSVPANWAGDSVHLWLSFVGVDGKVRSTSYYAGSLTVL